MPEITEEILARCKKGDLSAFRQLVETYQSYAYSLALRILCNSEDARDVVQESFIRVWKNVSGFDIGKRFSTWFYKIVTHLCLDHLKSKKRKNKLFIPENAGADKTDRGTDVEQDCINREIVEQISRLAEGLTPKQRIVFVLRDLQDFEMEEIVRISGLSRNTVKSNLYYARLNIRAKLEALENE